MASPTYTYFRLPPKSPIMSHSSVALWEEILSNVILFTTIMILAKIISVLWRLRSYPSMHRKIAIPQKKLTKEPWGSHLADPVRKPDHCVQVKNRSAFMEKVKVGQHYAVRRMYLSYPLYHHFLITDVTDSHIRLIHYNGTAGIFLSSGSKIFGCVYEDEISKEDVLYLDIPSNLFFVRDPRYPTEAEEISHILRRARSRLGENRYGITYNNCEHFVRWAITGQPQCRQYDVSTVNDKVVGAMVDELPHIGVRFGMKLIKEVLYGLTMGVEQFVLQSSARLIQHTASASIASILSTGAATFGYTAPVEAAFLTFRILDWKYHMSNGTMHARDYNNAKDKAITGSVFSLVLTTLGAVFGQLVIPLPALGAVLGSFWGGFIGRLLGIILAGYGIAIKEKYEWAQPSKKRGRQISHLTKTAYRWKRRICSFLPTLTVPRLKQQ